MDNKRLWTTRHIAEYCYCPRLFYLEEVEGIFISSADVETGLNVHHRVDQPSMDPNINDNENINDDNQPKIIRSFWLTHEELGYTGKLDLVELNGKNAVPVEYRKGKPYRKETIPESPSAQLEVWPADRIQVLLQAVLLMDNGYQVTEGRVYYSTEKRYLSISVTSDSRQEVISILEEINDCASGKRPNPLLNHPRCPKCSLQPYCLPDEISFTNSLNHNEEPIPRQILTPCDEGSHLVVQSFGSIIKIQGQTVHIYDKDEKRLKEIPLAGLSSVMIVGPIQITTQAIQVLSERGITISFMSSAGRLISIIEPFDSTGVFVRKAQLKSLENYATKLELSKHIVISKISNQRTMLMRNCDSLPPDIPLSMQRLIEKAEESKTLESLLGYEGQAAALYFKHFPDMLKTPLGKEFSENGRSRRPPPDPVNSCLSMGYSMLVNECISALRTARLEPSLGAYHTYKPGRPALACDLMEPFRPLVADSIALSAFNKGELAEGHFIRSASGCLFTPAGRKSFFNAYGRRMDTEITHPFYGYRLSYRRMIYLHARMIAAWFTGEINQLSFLITR